MSRYWRHSAKRKRLIGKYKSVLEARFAADMEAKGIEFRYEPETLEYRTRVVRGVCDSCGNGKTSQLRTYLPDFRIELGGSDSGSYIYIETKGRLTSADRSKMVAVKRDHPGLDIRIVFGSDNKLRKNNDKRYSDWAREHDFAFGVGAKFPDEWMGTGIGVPGTGTGRDDSRPDPATNSKGRRQTRRRKGRGAPTPTGPSDRDIKGT